MERTNESGKEENDEEPVNFEAFDNISGSDFCNTDDEELGALALEVEGSALSFPCFFNHSRIGGSFRPAHVTSTPSSPYSFRPLAQAAENAPPICLNGTSAVPILGGFVGASLGGLRERTMDDVSISPNCERRDESADAVMRPG